VEEKILTANGIPTCHLQIEVLLVDRNPVVCNSFAFVAQAMVHYTWMEIERVLPIVKEEVVVVLLQMNLGGLVVVEPGHGWKVYSLQNCSCFTSIAVRSPTTSKRKLELKSEPLPSGTS
jgi:hypothetical protein